MNGVHDAQRLAELTALPLERKIQISQTRIIEWYTHYKGNVCVAFSGGKDSCVILELAKMAGVNFEAHYNVTSVDPPELVRFVKDVHPEVSFDIPHDKHGKPISMWSLLKEKSTPPTRIARYCCKKLKESSGKGTVTITGVRWAESANRAKNQGLITITQKGADKIQEVQATNFTQTVRGGWC